MRKLRKKKNQSPEAKLRRALRSFYYLFFVKFKDATKERKIQTLKFFAQKRFGTVPKEQLEFKRKKFNKQLSNENGTILRYKGKEGKIIIVECKVCELNNSYVRHHIIQLQNGGHNGRKNRIALCEKCHNEVHPWLN